MSNPSPGATFNRYVLVHESVSHWTAEMERLFAEHTEIIFRWRPYREELFDELHLASLILLVVAPDDDSLSLIQQLKSTQRSLPMACLIKQMSVEWEWLARELGADVILSETTEKWRVAHSLRRLLHVQTAAV